VLSGLLPSAEGILDKWHLFVDGLRTDYVEFINSRITAANANSLDPGCAPFFKELTTSYDRFVKSGTEDAAFSDIKGKQKSSVAEVNILERLGRYANDYYVYEQFSKMFKEPIVGAEVIAKEWFKRFMFTVSIVKETDANLKRATIKMYYESESHPRTLEFVSYGTMELSDSTLTKYAYSFLLHTVLLVNKGSPVNEGLCLEGYRPVTNAISIVSTLGVIANVSVEYEQTKASGNFHGARLTTGFGNVEVCAYQGKSEAKKGAASTLLILMNTNFLKLISLQRGAACYFVIGRSVEEQLKDRRPDTLWQFLSR